MAGQEYLAPPPAGAHPLISGPRAFALARKVNRNPGGLVVTQVALTSYTNSAQGHILADGGTRLFYVQRLTWAVIDQGGTCGFTNGPAPLPHSSARPAVTPDNCLSITYIDARTGRSFGTSDSGGPGTPTLPAP